MKGMIAWFAHNPVAANLLMGIIILGGAFSIPMIQQKTFPDMEIEIVQIAVPYLGAAPEEVESGVCVRIEEEISGINGVERITSSSVEGACAVTAELIDGYPLDRALGRAPPRQRAAAGLSAPRPSLLLGRSAIWRAR